MSHLHWFFLQITGVAFSAVSHNREEAEDTVIYHERQKRQAVSPAYVTGPFTNVCMLASYQMPESELAGLQKVDFYCVFFYVCNLYSALLRAMED